MTEENTITDWRNLFRVCIMLATDIIARIPRTALSCLSGLCQKIELDAKTRKKFMPPQTTTKMTPKKQHICLVSASCRQDKNRSPVGFQIQIL